MTYQVGRAFGQRLSVAGQAAQRLDGRADGVWLRVGTSAVTRVGMSAPEMAAIARLLARLLRDGEAPARVAPAVEALAAGFREVRFA